MRERAQRAVASGLPSSEAALARGMVLGQDEAIAEGVREDFRASGLAHLLAVSGQNVMLLVALALPLLAVAGLGPRGRGVLLLGLVALYVPLAGAGPSLQRAGVMGAAGIAAMTLSRPASRWYALLLAATATLALNPRAWEDPGWQLSFAAVVGILCLGVPLARALTRAAAGLVAAPRRHPGVAAPNVHGSAAPSPRLAHLRAALVRGLAEGTAITLAATLATAPLLAHHFDAVPVAGLPANLLALPAVAPAMWLGMLKAGLGLVAPVLPPADWGAAALGADRAAPRRVHRPPGRAVRPASRRPGVVAASVARRSAARLWAACTCRSRGRPGLAALRAACRGGRRSLAQAPARPPARGRGRRRRRGHPRRAARVRPAGAARRAHRPLPGRRAGRRHAHPASGRQCGVVRRRPARGRHGATAAQGGRARAHRRRGDARLTRPPRRLRRGAGALRGRPAARRRRRQFGPGIQERCWTRPRARTSGPCRPTRR